MHLYRDAAPIAGLIMGSMLFLSVYLLPATVAFIRKKRNTWAIFWLNLLLGLTIIVWIVTMTWALGNDASQSTTSAQ